MMHIKEEHAAGDDNDYLRTCVQNEEKKVANVINVNRCDFCHVVVESEKILREQHPITCLGLKRLEKFTECEFSSKSLPISWQVMDSFLKCSYSNSIFSFYFSSSSIDSCARSCTWS